ncbi:hypothetical protein DFH08DRAFT_958429 [Mycena albidolilacea]|uniref:Uncharacterized protein n=1 Tax=Mycena albidolilacea TaxID=1033008 RepID=A0AAD7A6X7_9AGAR|nr:hypothetical protein DFH08DRAFT_958429 [Mycena albidolilacea]
MLPESAESILFRCGRKAGARTSAHRAAFSALVAGPGLPIFASSDGSSSRTAQNAPHCRYSRLGIIDIALGLRAAVSLLFSWSDRCRSSAIPPPYRGLAHLKLNRAHNTFHILQDVDILADLVSLRQTENWSQPSQAQDPVLTEYPEARRSQGNRSTLPLGDYAHLEICDTIPPHLNTRYISATAGDSAMEAETRPSRVVRSIFGGYTKWTKIMTDGFWVITR